MFTPPYMRMHSQKAIEIIRSTKTWLWLEDLKNKNLLALTTERLNKKDGKTLVNDFKCQNGSAPEHVVELKRNWSHNESNVSNMIKCDHRTSVYRWFVSSIDLQWTLIVMKNEGCWSSFSTFPVQILRWAIHDVIFAIVAKFARQ